MSSRTESITNTCIAQRGIAKPTMFENGIRFSQLLALIRVTHEPKHIRVRDGNLAYKEGRREIMEDESDGNLSIEWDRGIGNGQEKHYLCFTLDGFEYKSEWMKKRGISLWREGWSYNTKGNLHVLDSPQPFLRAYYYGGDNCNDRTDFLWQIVALQTKVYDDIGIVGGGWGNYSNGIITGCKGDNHMERERVEHEKIKAAEIEKMKREGKIIVSLDD